MNKLFFLLSIVLALLLTTPAHAQFGPVNDIDNKYATDLPKAGSDAPMFKLKTIDGKTFKLSSLKGKVVVLDFWASWCPDCRHDMPDVKRIYERFSNI